MAEPAGPDVCRPPVASFQRDVESAAELTITEYQLPQPDGQNEPVEPPNGATNQPPVDPPSATSPIDVNRPARDEIFATNLEKSVPEESVDSAAGHTLSAVVEPQVLHGAVDGANGMEVPISHVAPEEEEMVTTQSPAQEKIQEPPMQSDLLPEGGFLGEPASLVDAASPEEPVSHEDDISLVEFVQPEVADQQPLDSATSVQGDIPSTTQPTFSSATETSPECASSSSGLEHDRDEGSSGVLRLKPTRDQWEDFPAILSAARKLGAEKDGCFKVVLSEELMGPLPERPALRVPANAYRTHLIDRTRIWQVGTIPTEADFPSSSEDLGPRYADDPDKAFAKLRTLFTKNKDRKMRDVRYRVDVPAWNAEQRKAAGVPERSPLYPLKGDKLDRTRAIIPGIHTPYVYESGPAFGATFQIHAEDFRLSSLNHLYKGRKIWIVIPSSAVDLAEEKLERRGKCSQFMRHRAEFVFPTKLERLAIPYRVIDQQPGETIVILPDAYHEGFSTGYTLAEAKNYAEDNWSVHSYQPCDRSCNLPTAIPAAYMELVEEGDGRIDLCALHDAEIELQRKRKREEEEGTEQSEVADEHEAQRPRLSASAEVASVG